MSLTPKQIKMQGQMLSPFKFGLFKILKLPLAFLTGIKIKELTKISAVTSVEYKYLNTNPFDSLYFAVLAMSAELSTGMLALFSIAKYDQSISVLVVESSGKFYKKAVGKIDFICEDGELFQEGIEKCVQENESKIVKAKSKGFNQQNELVCEYEFTWSFKVRSMQ